MGDAAGRERKGSKAGAKPRQAHPDRQHQAPGLDRVIQAQIGDKLRAMYGELVEQPVPDKLAAILDRLSHGNSSKGSA